MTRRFNPLGPWWIVLLLSVAGFAANSDVRLIEGVKDKNKEAVSSLLKERADVNTSQQDGTTPLHWAAHWNDMQMADLLIRAGAKVDAANVYGVTPLSLACTNRSAGMVGNLLKA